MNVHLVPEYEVKRSSSQKSLTSEDDTAPYYINSHESFDFKANSLPRRKCNNQHTEEYFTNSLPRKEHSVHHKVCRHVTECSKLPSSESPEQFQWVQESKESLDNQECSKRRASAGIDVIPRTHSFLRRQSIPLHCYQAMAQAEENDPAQYYVPEKSPSPAVVPEIDGNHEPPEEEQEILIDFEPRISPPLSPYSRQKKLKKTLSDGEIVFEKRQCIRNSVAAGISEDESVSDSNKEPEYQNLPIRIEDPFEKKHLLTLPLPTEDALRLKREAFRKRSISLEDPNICEETRLARSAPSSPNQKELLVQSTSPYPSTDSLANDLTRDHSEGGIWNESQATVLHAEAREEDETLLQTQSQRRKTLVLQHQQRSSIDTDALETEDQLLDQSVPRVASPFLKPAATQTASPLEPTIESTTTVTVPNISLSPSDDKETDDHQVPRRMSSTIDLPRTLSSERKKVEPVVHATSPQRLIQSPEAVHLPQEHSPNRIEVIMRNNTDISECSTNTDDYVTCTDNSKKQADVKTSTTVSSSSTQIPVSAQSSQIVTHDGSSFESASSLYSAKGEILCDEVQQVEEVVSSLEADPTTPKRLSPTDSAQQPPETSPIRTNVSVKLPPATKKSESFSEDDRSEKGYSSSGYNEKHGVEHRSSKFRRLRELNEDERRRRKNNIKLDIERENLRALTSPSKKPIADFKPISPEERPSMIIDGATCQSKSKRHRIKVRRQHRNKSSSGDDILTPRKPKESPSYNNQERRATTYSVPTKLNPSVCHVSCISPKTPRPESDSIHRLGLEAKSTESLRSVSPGSDSVFFSEVDVSAEQQVHCYHCGKEVEIIAAVSGSQESIIGIEREIPGIVKPPADFADSPVTTKSGQRLYKKMDKRFRSEERQVDRRSYRIRQECVRAKSEERGKDQSESGQTSLRPAGSSPCVMPEAQGATRGQAPDPEQGVYHGNYKMGMWICIADHNVWRRDDQHNVDYSRDTLERRGSTNSEKEFRKKYQAITHRLVHRRSCVEMYRRQSTNSFFTDKTIVVRRESGEFGFRIHGSKPVVVSAIETDTPAESSGLGVGDIVLSVNGICVIDKTHSEVVKIAHAGSDTLELEVAKAANKELSEKKEDPNPPLYSGYLWRQSRHLNGTLKTAKWIRRWFSLRSDHCLYFFITDKDIQPVGAVLLTNHTVQHCKADDGRPHAFKIYSGDGLTLYLAADSEESANRWVLKMCHASKQGDPWLETSMKFLKLFPSNIPKTDCCGYLMKLGSRWHGWSKRFCVLKDACIYFYQDEHSKGAIGMACLQGYRVQSNVVGKKHAFEIAPSEPKLRHYYFSTESEMDKKRWVAALEYSIDRWMKAC